MYSALTPFLLSMNWVIYTYANPILFHEQVQSLGLDMQKDTGFNEKLVTYLYALEVRACVLTGSELAWLNGRA